MRKKYNKSLVVTLTAVGVLLVGAGIAFTQRHEIQRFSQRATLPSAIPYTQTPTPLSTKLATPSVAAATKQASPTPKPVTSLPAEINLAVPFTVQAPFAVWDIPHEEFCEEASVLMAMRYVQQKPISGPADADQALLEIKSFEEKRFGYFKDTDAKETADIIKEHFKYPKVQLLENPTVAQIKQALASNKPVIVPAAGQQLGNPYFRQPGPVYHMIVIKGYTKNGEFITNDPGTRRGADYLYKESVLMNAMHDWKEGSPIESGRKVVLIVG